MKIDVKDVREISELLREMCSYSWVVVPVGENPVKAEDVMFCDSKEEADHKIGVHDFAVSLPLDVLQERLQIAFAEMPADTIAGSHDHLLVLNDNELLAAAEQWMVAYKKAEALNRELMDWGLADDMTRYLAIFTYDNSDYFILETGNYLKGTPDKYTVKIEADSNGEYHIASFVYEEKRDIKVLNVSVGEINSLALDAKMSKIDWNNVSHGAFHGISLNRDELFYQVQKVADQLAILSITGHGKIAADQLAAKYFLDTPLEQYLMNQELLRRRFVSTHEFLRDGDLLFTMQEAYNLMHRRCVCKKIEQNGIRVEPWFYMIPSSAEGPSKAFRIPGSESVDVQKIIEEKKASGIHFDLPDKEIVNQLKKGEQVRAELRRDSLIQQIMLWFDALSSRLKAELLPRCEQLRKSPDEHLKRGRSI